MLYPSGFCECSSSCKFVKEYLQNEANNDQVEMVSMRSYSGIMTPVNGQGAKFDPDDLKNTLEVSILLLELA